MSQPSEYSSEEESSQNDTEYHSESGLKSEKKQIILVNSDEEFTFLNIWFPLPHEFPKPYIMLNKVMSNPDDALLKPYEWTHNIAEDPENTLAYIITHFNIDRVSQSIHSVPKYKYNQVYYSTYIDTSRFLPLQRYFRASAIKLQKQNALVQKWLELELLKQYARYYPSDDLSPYILQCIL